MNHTHLDLFQQERSKVRTTIINTQTTSVKIIAQELNMSLALTYLFCNKPYMFESQNSFFDGNQASELFPCIETMRDTVINNSQAMNQMVP